MKVLHIGCGRKKIAATSPNGECIEVISLDADAQLHPDVVCHLGRDPIPLPDNSIDVVVAIHALEHIGKTGETQEWFYFWEELYRVLRNKGHVEFISPIWNSVWAWGDPSHVRALSPESFYFFNQTNYRTSESPISPFRIRCDFTPGEFHEPKNGNFAGVLVARKPLVPWWEHMESPCHPLPALSASPVQNMHDTQHSMTNSPM